MSDVTETNRWRGVIAVALAAGAVGVLASRPSLLLLSIVGVVFATYPRLSPLPGVDLQLDRRVSNPSPAHGERIDVSVTVTNAGARTLPDLRVVDGVPAVLQVVDGSPRRGMALRPGSSATFSYTVEAQRGTHSFEPATVVARDVSGAREVETTVHAELELDCTDDLASVPLRDQTLASTGRITANVGGTGTEFYRTRAYRHGDPMNRVDWNRYARTGALTTVEYREERTATVVLLIDARRVAYRGRADEPHAVAASVSAAEQLLHALLDDRNWVGIAAVGRSSCWFEPGSGAAHADDAVRLLRTHEAFSSRPPVEDADVDHQLAALRERLSRNAQLVILSPLTDDTIAAAARTLEADGHRVTVISSDVTDDETSGRRLAKIERRNRVNDLRSAGIAVFEWTVDEPLAVALAVDGRGDPV